MRRLLITFHLCVRENEVADTLFAPLRKSRPDFPAFFSHYPSSRERPSFPTVFAGLSTLLARYIAVYTAAARSLHARSMTADRRGCTAMQQAEAGGRPRGCCESKPPLIGSRYALLLRAESRSRQASSVEPNAAARRFVVAAAAVSVVPGSLAIPRRTSSLAVSVRYRPQLQLQLRLHTATARGIRRSVNSAAAWPVKSASSSPRCVPRSSSSSRVLRFARETCSLIFRVFEEGCSLLRCAHAMIEA